MKRSLCAAIVMSLSVVGLFAAEAAAPKMDKSICVVHRGWGLIMPENTIIALQHCWETGFLPEADARISSDGVMYAFHDSFYKGRPMKERSWAEVQEIDVGAMKGEKWAGKGIKAPTWDEIFAEMAKDSKRCILMDHKDAPMKMLYESAKKHGVERQIWWCQGSIAACTQWKKLVPDGRALAWIPYGSSWKRVDYADTARLEDIDRYVREKVADWEKQGFGGADIVELIVNVNVDKPTQSAPSMDVIADAMHRIRKAGKKAAILVWDKSADSLECYRTLYDKCRPDCFGTDYPLRLKEFLGL